MARIASKTQTKSPSSVNAYSDSDEGVCFPQLLPQALRQGRHSVLGGAVEMCVSAGNNPMSTHAETDKRVGAVVKINQVKLCG